MRLGLFRNMVGRDPYLDPLLKRRGLDTAPVAEAPAPTTAK